MLSNDEWRPLLGQPNLTDEDIEEFEPDPDDGTPPDLDSNNKTSCLQMHGIYRKTHPKVRTCKP
jgi:hypothetical protein